MDNHLELAVWTAGSLLLSAAGAQLAWIAMQHPQSGPGRFRTGWAGNPLGRALVFFVRLVFCIGIPYVALMRHVLSPVVIGLLGTQTADLPWWMLGWSPGDWIEAARWSAVLGGIAAVALLLGWWNARRAMRSAFLTSGLLSAPPLFVTACESFFAEIHWAFYRAAPLAFIADPYWAILVGAALVVVEWTLDPAWHAGWADGPQRAPSLMQMGWLALSTTIFMMARNVWPIILLHVMLAWAVGRWVALQAAWTKETSLPDSLPTP